MNEPRLNRYWSKARIAARLILKQEAKQPWNARDHDLAEQFYHDPGVTNRLLDQAVKNLTASKRNGSSLFAQLNTSPV